MLHSLRRYSVLLLWVPFTLSSPLPESIDAGQADKNARVDQLFARWNKTDSPGCALAVLQDGKLVYESGYGMANLEQRTPITPATIFNIASVSKQFTAFLIMLLVAAGQLDLDDDVRRHVPQMPDFGKTITVRHLVHHTSGLREDWSLLALAGWRAEDVVTERDVLDLLYRQRELNFEPGSEYLYCNSGYMLMGQIVRKVSGKSVRQLAQEKIFTPLEMKNSVLQDDNHMLIPSRAASYRPQLSKSFVHVHFATDRAGPSNLYTNVLDMARWDQNFYDPKVGGKAVLDLMHTRGKLKDGKEIPYAGGLIHGEYRGLKMVAHTGSVAGYRSILARFPEARFSVILLSNVSDFNAQEMARQVANIHLEGTLKPAAEKKAPEPKKDKKKKGPVLTAKQMAEYTGDFHSDELDVVYRVLVRDDKLFLRHRKGETVLQPSASDTFTADILGSVTIRYARNGEVKVSGLAVSTPRARNLRFAKVEIKRT
jgi:CubicO group peptidase (beta-lactamase class C family)